MSVRRLSRSGGEAAPPVRLVHLGLGNFFRAHTCWHTQHARDGAEWGFAAFTGRTGGPLVGDLNAQDGLFTLVSRGGDRDRFEVIGSVARAHAAADHAAWLALFAQPALAAVTITVTEAGYLLGPDAQDEVAALRRDPAAPVRGAPARLVAGLAARRRADAGPLAIVPCDNTPGNGALAQRVVHEVAERVDPELAAWIPESIAVVTTMVDRITPRTAPEDVTIVREATGADDRCPVVSEPFHEWVLGGEFPGGRPRWEDAGATFTDDVTPYEHRKLWLLNGAHSLLAYAGSIRGHTTVAEAIGDETCRSWVQEWWAVAAPRLGQPQREVESYEHELLERFANARVHDRLDRIAADGSQKLPIRILPALRAERAAGRTPVAATRVLAAWICHVRGLGAPVTDARADEILPLAQGPLRDAVRRTLGFLDGDLGADEDVVAQVTDQCEQLAGERAA